MARRRGPVRTRSEHDLLGTRDVPEDVYWGVHTLRATENFPITGLTVARYPTLVRGLAAVKRSAAEANREAGALEPAVARVVAAAAEEVRCGALLDQFVVDVVQGGAGTSTNMNANEVIANRALELFGLPRGRYDVIHPIEHVNLSQSTNDVYPTASRLALLDGLDELGSAVRRLHDALVARAADLGAILKLGRTQLQDAVPLTVGQELGAYATSLAVEMRQLEIVGELLSEVNLGGTAVGTGLTAPTGYAAEVVERLATITGRALRPAADRVEATQSVGGLVACSAALRAVALKVSRLSNDLRLLSSGPRAGLGELELPAVQAGSSMMPGKVNPVIPEAVNQVAFATIGRDLTVTMAAEAGQLQLNAFAPVIVASLLDSMSQLAVGCRLLADRCVDGMRVDAARLREHVEGSAALAAAMVPVLGYERATAIAAEAAASGRSVAEVARGQGLGDIAWDRARPGLHEDEAGSVTR